MPDPTPARQRLLDAAVALLGERGVQAVSHRSVEERAGVARGSTRYYFHTREALLEAVLEHMAAQANGLLAQAAAAVEGGSLQPGTMDAATQAQAMQAMVGAMLADPGAELARFELFLYAARRPELTETVLLWRDTFVQLAAAHLRAQGAQAPEAAARLTIAALDGMLLHALSGPHLDYQEHGPAWMAAVSELAARFPASDEPPATEPATPATPDAPGPRDASAQHPSQSR